MQHNISKRDYVFWLWILTCVVWGCYLGFGNIDLVVALGLIVAALVSLTSRLLLLEVQPPTPLNSSAPQPLRPPYRTALQPKALRPSATFDFLDQVAFLPKETGIQVLLDLSSPRRQTQATLQHRTRELERLVIRLWLQHPQPKESLPYVLKQLRPFRSAQARHALVRVMTESGDFTC